MLRDSDHPTTQTGLFGRLSWVSGPSISRSASWIGLAVPLFLLLAWAGIAAANVRVNQDPAGAVQNSPSITLDPLFGNIVVAYVDTPGSGRGVGASYRPIAGGNWLDSGFPAFGWHGWEQDPSVASDQGGFVHLCQASYDLVPPNNNLSGIYVSSSGNGGTTFGAPVRVAYYPQGLPRIVKPKIEVDDFRTPPSPYYRNVYVAWQEDGFNLNASDARFARSTDSGFTWFTLLNPINDNRGNDQVTWPDLAVGSDGSVVTAWLETPNWIPQHQGQIWVDRSVNGGLSFGTDVPAVTFWTVPAWLTDGNGTPTVPATSYVSVEVDPSNPNRIGAVYAADPDDGTPAETRIDFGDLPPGSSDAWLLNPFHGGSNLSCNRSFPNYAYSVWIDHRSGRDVYFSRGQIVNGIANWTGDTRVSNFPAGQYHWGSNNASVVSSGANVYVAWDEWTGGDFVHLIYFNRSTNNGATWLAQPINLDTQHQVAYNPSISCDGNNVCVVWEVGRDATHVDIYGNYSTNGGSTWQPSEIPIRTGQWAMKPQVAQVANYAIVTWMEGFGAGATSDIYASWSSNYGQNWSAPIRLDFNDPIGNSISYAPKICCNRSGGVFVVWEDKRVNGIENPYFAYSRNFGITWQGDFRLNTGVPAGNSRDYYSQIACDGNYVAVVYESDRAQLNGPEDIYLNCSTDGGVTWFASDVRQDVGDAVAANGSGYSRVSVYDYGHPDQGYVYTTWMDDRNGPPYSGWDVYGTYGSYDPTSGQWTWLNGDYRIDVGDQPGANDSWHPHVASDWTGPYYVYRDVRNGQGDIYANQYRTGPDEGDVFYVQSTDAGATWGRTIRVNDDVGTNDQSHPWLDIKPNGIVDVIFYDRRNDPMDHNPELYMASLLPGATAFSPNVAITNQPIVIPPLGNWYLGDYTWVDVDRTDAHCTWTDTRRANDNLLGDAFYNLVPNPSLGACCLPSGTCQVMTPSACASEGGEYVGDGVPCDPNPCEQEDSGDHDVGNCILTVTDQGIVGFMDATQQIGSGFVYPRNRDGVNQLYIGSLWVGLGADYIANRDYNDDPDREWVVSTDPDGHIWFGQDESDQDIHAGFTDDGAAAPRDLYVEQLSGAYGNPEPADDFVMIRYTVQNRSDASIEGVYVGLFLDFDLEANVDDDEGAAISETGLVYLNDPSGTHAGVLLLQPEDGLLPVANLTLIHNPTYVWPQAHLLDADKFAFLSAADPEHVLTESFEPNDYSILASAGPFDLGPGGSQEVCFAIVGGLSLYELEQNVSAAQVVYLRGINDTPEPDGSLLRGPILLPNIPNPFALDTTIRFELPGDRPISLTVHDVAGRRVRRLADGTWPAGLHTVRWDGRDTAGRRVADGIYFLRLTAGRDSASRPLLLLR